MDIDFEIDGGCSHTITMREFGTHPQLIAYCQRTDVSGKQKFNFVAGAVQTLLIKHLTECIKKENPTDVVHIRWSSKVLHSNQYEFTL